MNIEDPKKILEDMEEAGELRLNERVGNIEDVHDPSFVRGAQMERSDNVTELFEATFGVVRAAVMEYPLDEDGYFDQRNFEMEVTNTIRDVLGQIGDEYRDDNARAIALKKGLLDALMIQFQADYARVPKDTRPMLAARYVREELRAFIPDGYMAVDPREVKTERRSVPEGVRVVLLEFNEMIRGFSRQDTGEELSVTEKELVHTLVDEFLAKKHEANPEHLKEALRIMYEEQDEAMNEDVDGRWNETFERIDAFCDTHRWKIGDSEGDDDFLV